jgi:Lon protease-like protein
MIMSSASVELPLFPLDVVLFPGTALPLHIFEPRYRTMIVDCLDEDKPFGIVLVKPESAHLREEPYPVGTMATIRDLDELEDGHFNLMAMGTTRFRIVSQHREKPYLSGIVEPFEDTVEPEEELSALTRQARTLFGRYLDLLVEAVSEQEIEESLPCDAQALSLFIANFLDIANEQKQHYLELTSAQQRLQEEIYILRREVPFMRQILSAKLPDERAKLN